MTLCAIGLHAGCLQAASLHCDDGALCPPGLQCAGDDRICVLVTCGNGDVDPGETCDDGNNRSGDGCPADCSPPCGDGVLDMPSEACDDGNTNDGDGCSADCLWLDNYSINPPAVVTFMAMEGGELPESVRLTYRGDVLLWGFPPEVPQPTWLSIRVANIASSLADFELRPTDTAIVGLRLTSVSFVVRHQNSRGLEIFDLAVAYEVEPSGLAVQDL